MVLGFRVKGLEVEGLGFRQLAKPKTSYPNDIPVVSMLVLLLLANFTF